MDAKTTQRKTFTDGAVPVSLLDGFAVKLFSVADFIRDPEWFSTASQSFCRTCFLWQEGTGAIRGAFSATQYGIYPSSKSVTTLTAFASLPPFNFFVSERKATLRRRVTAAPTSTVQERQQPGRNRRRTNSLYRHCTQPDQTCSTGKQDYPD